MPLTLEEKKLFAREVEPRIPATRRRAALDRFSEFFRLVARGRDGQELGLPPIGLLLADTMQHCFEHGVHLSIVGPPSLFKSTMARHFMTWALGRNPMLRTVAVSAELSLSKRVTGACRKIIIERLYRELFPAVKLDTTKARRAEKEETDEEALAMGNEIGRFYFRNSGADPDPAMEAVAAQPTGQMRRVDIGLFDDMETRETARSKARREETRRTFFQTWLDGRLKNGDKSGWALCIQNLWHKEDLASHLRETPRFCSLWFGVSDDLRSLVVTVTNAPPGFPLLAHPHRYEATAEGEARFRVPMPPVAEWSPERLKQIMDTNPDARTQYKLKAMDDSERMFPSWGKRWVVPGNQQAMFRETTLDNGRLVFPPHVAARYRFAAGNDYSSPRRPGDCIAIPCIDANGILRLAEIHYGNFSEEERFHILNDAWLRGMRFQRVRCEINGLQGKFEDELRRIALRYGAEWAWLIESHETGSNKSRPEVGLPSIEQRIAMQKFQWAQACTETGNFGAEHFRRFAAEMQDCPRVLAPNETPDGTMAFWMGTLALDPNGAFAGQQALAQDSVTTAGAGRRYEYF